MTESEGWLAVALFTVTMVIGSAAVVYIPTRWMRRAMAADEAERQRARMERRIDRLESEVAALTRRVAGTYPP